MSKKVNKIIKRDKLWRRKNKLINKIKRCKTSSKVESYEKLFEYYPVLSKDGDFDFGFLLILLEFKLKKMSHYFHTHDIVVNEEYYGRLCDTAPSLLNAAYLNEIILDEDLGEIYVNTKNKYRFLPKSLMNNLSDEFGDKYGLANLRTFKAKKIFWKFMYHYIERLWD